jgi:AraC family transcriptional regulator of adaptative response/methylated-DNA-[protein]-cysteine methyltransferase
VATRNADYDGVFVFAVRSTGIFCRPSCPARRPAPQNVRFFRSADEALGEGFRPCTRCLARRVALEPREQGSLQRLCREIERAVAAGDNMGSGETPGAGNWNGRVTLSDLARHSGLGPFRVHRLFRRALGITPRQYADAVRLRRFKQSLRSGGNVTTALYEAGYGSSSRLYERSSAQLGMTPGSYRRGGDGTEIRYAIADSPLGRVLVGATPRGVCAVMLGKPDAQLVHELVHDFPRAVLREDARGLGTWVRGVLAQIRGHQDEALPLDIRGTAFQRRVWEELRRIPAGETRSYSEVARRIGRPRAVRAVARACAMNHASVVVPCHRVVGKDGGLHGYRWGLERKRALLEIEKRGARAASEARRAPRARLAV